MFGHPKFLILFACLWSAAASAEGLKLRAINYNAGLLEAPVWGDLVPLVKLRAAVFPELIAERLKEEGADLAMFEEVWTERLRSRTIQTLERAGYIAVEPRGPGLWQELQVRTDGAGMVFALRRSCGLKIVSAQFFPWEENDFFTARKFKGIFAVRLSDEEGHDLLVVGAHSLPLTLVRAKGATPSSEELQIKEMLQLIQLGRVITDLNEGGRIPVLVLADLNVGPGYFEDQYAILSGFDGLRDRALNSEPSWDPSNPLVAYGHYPHEPAATIDHILTADGAASGWSQSSYRVIWKDPVQGLSLRGEDIPLSDHYGVEADLILGAH